MSKPQPELQDDQFCFVCGRENPYGLKLSFDLDTSRHTVTTRFVPERWHQGWKNRLHGGILSTIMDEVMVNAAYLTDMPAVTGEMSFRFREPLDTRQTITVTGRLVEIRAKFIKAESICRLDDGTTVAEGTALLIRLNSVPAFRSGSNI